MRDDYLWDGSGEPDPEIQKLETVLGSLRHSRPAPAFPEITGLQPQPARPRFWQIPWIPRFAVAAAILVTGGIGLMMLYTSNSKSQAGWEVTRVSGDPRVGSRILGDKTKTGKLGLGQILETDDQSQASIRLEEIGEIIVDPHTKLGLNNSGVKRLSLEHGTVHAYIWAPAGEFVIDTPSAVAVDLGCAYTLHVDDDGNGLLHTTMGWVGFKLADHEAFIPAGAFCPTHRKSGPGIPYFEDASEDFRSALSKLNQETSSPDEKAAALHMVVSQARKQDALSLWHLLSRVPEPDRGEVYDRLAHFFPPPAGVTREAILRLDQNMLDLWWNDLGFGDASLWRHWERTWTGQEK